MLICICVSRSLRIQRAPFFVDLLKSTNLPSTYVTYVTPHRICSNTASCCLLSIRPNGRHGAGEGSDMHYTEVVSRTSTSIQRIYV